MNWPRISIVTPSYNQGKYIERTVRSVLLQRYPNLDYILMDGGSTDDTVSRLAPYKDRFTFFSSEPDNGQADAIAKGFARSSGDIMAYLNSDDLLAPDALHFVANFFERNPAVDFVYSHRCTVDENDKVLWYWILPPHLNFFMKRWDFIPQETCFWRRSLFEKAGPIDPSYHFAMDYDLFVRFMNLGRMRRVNRFLAAFRQHSESKTTQLLGIMGRREMLRVRQKYGISRLPRDGFLGMLFGQHVSRAGGRFACAGSKLPGAFPGAGYDYNDLWGGTLRRPDLQSERNRIGESEKRLYDPISPVTSRFPDRLLFTIASAKNGRALTSDIYLECDPRTAIILPSLSEHWRQKKKKKSNGLVGGAHSVTSNDPARDGAAPETRVEEPDGPRLSVDRISMAGDDENGRQILELTRGLVSENDQIDFLEVDCWSGELLDTLRARTKWKLTGLERNPPRASEAVSKGYEVFEATLEEAAGLSAIGKCFDLIYLARGIQCFSEPRACLRSVAVLLKPGGFLALSTPNLGSEQLKRYGPSWAHWKPDEHRFIFSAKSLKRILLQSGFAPTRMWTASYPLSTVATLKPSEQAGAVAIDSGDYSGSAVESQTLVMTGSRQLLRNRGESGDVIFAICKRLF
jgi:GT2 family glycosyltransferase/SAM-dependent methyltransferase